MALNTVLALAKDATKCVDIKTYELSYAEKTTTYKKMYMLTFVNLS